MKAERPAVKSGRAGGRREPRPGVSRSLDAIHLAAAQLFGEELTAVVTYDRRMAAAAGLLDLRVATPR